MKVVDVALSDTTFKTSHLIEELSKHKKDVCVRLLLGSADIRWGDCSKIAAIVDGHPLCRVVALDLSRNSIGPEGVAALTTSRLLFNHLEELDVSFCLLESDGAALLGGAVHDCQFLRVLNLAGNRIGSYGLGAFALKGLKGNVALQKLVLDGNDIGDDVLSVLVACLGAHPSLVDLSLCGNAIGGAGFAVLSSALCKGTLALHRLSLGTNCLQKDSTTALATLLTSCTTLTELDLSFNALGGSKLDSVIVLSKGFDGMVMLGESLAVNKTLLSLDLSGNNVGKAGMRAFAEMLAVNKTLRRLVLDVDEQLESLELKRNTAVTDLGKNVPSTVAALLSRNCRLRDDFFGGIASGMAISKLKEMLEKGVDICSERGAGGLLEHAGPELVTLFFSLPHVRNYLFSSVNLFECVPAMEGTALKACAKEPGMLQHAARMGHAEAVKILLANGADPAQKDSMDRNAMVVATEYGHANVILALIQKGVDPRLTKFRLPLMLLAARNGHAHVVELFAGRYPKMMDAKSAPPKARSALHVAAKAGRSRVVAVLLELGMDPNMSSGDGFAPLHLAATPEICQLLLNAGAFVNVQSGEGKNALFYAVFPEVKGESPNLDVATFLLDHHAEKKAPFEAIETLDLRNMYRDHLPVWIGQLPNLQSLQVVEGNGLRSLPRNVVEGGDDSVREYLRDMGSGTKDVWESFKIMVLGKEGVGKTHIFHLCSRTDYPRDTSTDGIDIHSFKLGSQRVPVTWFDFGGQEVFLPTHELFLTGQCVYLLAFKMTEAEYAKRVMYWLKVVTSFSMDRAKVVIVGTHRDQLKNEEAEVEAISKRINQLTADSTTVVDKIYVSCLDDPDQLGDMLANALLAAAKHANLTGKEVPHIYTVIKEWVGDQRKRDKPRPYFAWDAFVECFPGYDPFLLERACEFLHDMGVLFLAKRSIGNKQANLVCVDIQWLARAFSAVVTFRHSWVRNGVLQQEALSHIWHNFGMMDMQDMLAIMALFEKFNIAFARRQEGCWIIPSMLAEATPALVSEMVLLEEVTHARQFKLSVVPTGAFGQIMARVSEWTDTAMLEMWRFGFVVRDATHIAMVTVENGCDLFLRICRATEERSDLNSNGALLRRIDDELQQIFLFLFRRLNTVPVEALILCPHCISEGLSPSECNWLRYNDIVKVVLAGGKVFACRDQEIPLPLLGDDLTFGYVKTIDPGKVAIEQEPLARGGFGMIFRGEMEGGVLVVVKELIIGQRTNVNLFIDFQHEVSLMAELRHPNLVRLHGIMFCPLRMVLELCVEGDLLHALAEGRIVGNALKFRIAIDIGKAMNYLHTLATPLAHRDLRSPNVLLVSRDPQAVVVAKVADFGLTVASTGRLQLELETWQWMAPETFLGENYTETCDLYSFGMVLWEIFMGTGEIPFESYTAQEKKKSARDFMNDIIHKDLRPVCGPSFPADVTALIQRLWEKEPDGRPSFAACLEVLEGAASGIKRDDGFLAGLVRKQRLAKPALLQKKTKRLTRVSSTNVTKSGWGVQRSVSAAYTAPEKGFQIGSKGPRARTSVSAISTPVDIALLEEEKNRRRTVNLPQKNDPKPLPKPPPPRGNAPVPETRRSGRTSSSPKKPLPVPSVSSPRSPPRAPKHAAPKAPAPRPPPVVAAPAPVEEVVEEPHVEDELADLEVPEVSSVFEDETVWE